MYSQKSQPGAIGNNMPAALKGEQPGYVSPNYLGRPANAKPFNPSSKNIPNNAMTVKDYTERNMQQRREYNKGRDSIWGPKWNANGEHSNSPYYEQQQK